VFLDRDGVINEDRHYVHKKNDFFFTLGIFEVLRYLKNLNYEFIIVTNQSGIGRKFFTEDKFTKLSYWMEEVLKKESVEILDTFYCPHVPEDNCYCRKPSPGLFEQAKKKYEINLSRSWMIGDSERDIISANVAGINNTIIIDKTNKPSIAKYKISSIEAVQNIIHS